MSNILVIDDTPENLHVLVKLLSTQGYEVRAVSDGAFGLESAYSTPPDVILLDIKMTGMDGYEVCTRLKANQATRDIPILFISALDDIKDKVKGFEAGGVDYITKPIQPDEVLARVKTHLSLHHLRYRLEQIVDERTAELQQALEIIQALKDRLQTENIYLREELEQEYNFGGSNGGITGQNELLKYLLFKLKKVAPTDATVLITGETGTGKELIARAVHHASLRSKSPLVKVNCAALPAHLIESELFGHEKGAFTGAIARQIGRFEFADGATIFLDEIGELPLELQAKLLRVIQDGEFERLGNPRTITVDVRIIAATNRNLEYEAQAGRFRQDLYYRLAVYPLSVPPLRERLDDIPALVRAFVQRFNKQLGKQIETIPKTALDILQQYAWPGNVRELENVIERAMILSQGATLEVEMPEASSKYSVPPRKTLETLERDYILQTLDDTNWKIYGPDGAAALLGLNPSTLRGRMRKLNIQKPDGKK